MTTPVDEARGVSPAGSSKISRWLNRLLRPAEVDEAVGLADQVSDAGAEPIGNCRRGEQVRVRGTIRSIAVRPECSSPTLEAELYDGSGHLTLVWMGRRVIPGIEVGRSLIAEGRLTCPDGQVRLYNPVYRLLPRVIT
jgi:RecG-like helicase